MKGKCRYCQCEKELTVCSYCYEDVKLWGLSKLQDEASAVLKEIAMDIQEIKEKLNKNAK